MLCCPLFYLFALISTVIGMLLGHLLFPVKARSLCTTPCTHYYKNSNCNCKSIKIKLQVKKKLQVNTKCRYWTAIWTKVYRNFPGKFSQIWALTERIQSNTTLVTHAVYLPASPDGFRITLLFTSCTTLFRFELLRTFRKSNVCPV